MEFFLELNLTQVFLLVFAVISGINCLYYLLFSKFSFSKHQKGTGEDVPVSVIVYSKNQAEQLPDFIEKLTRQSHFEYEIIIVNNASQDKTKDLLEDYEIRYPLVKGVNVVNNEAFWGSKKYAITLGIKKASHKHLLFTTLNAEIDSENWISKTSSLFSDQKQLILGYANYKKRKGILNRIMRYGKFISSLTNFGYAAIGKPNTGSEYNIGFNSDLFYENNGYSSHVNIPTGKESIFIKEAASSKNVALATVSKSIVRITDRIKYKDWVNDSKFNLQSFVHYKSGVCFKLRLFHFTQFLFWVLAITGIILFKISEPILFIIIAIRFLISGLVISKSLFKFSEKDLVYLFPLWEILTTCSQFFIFINNLFSKPKH